jgi:hypothetical protein
VSSYQKTFDYFGFGSSSRDRSRVRKVFWFFFKKEPLSAACLGPALAIPAYRDSYLFFKTAGLTYLSVG